MAVLSNILLENLDPTRRIFIKFYFRGNLKSLLTIQSSLKCEIIMITLLEDRYSFLIKSRRKLLRMKNSQTNLLKVSNTGLFVTNFFHKNRAVCVILWKILYARQATVHFARRVTKVNHSPRIRNNYCFPIATMVTRKQCTVTLYVNCLCCSMLRSIAVHIHSVFCVLCTVCGNVQQCAGTAVLRGNCSAV